MKAISLAALCAAWACIAMAGEASPRWKMFDLPSGFWKKETGKVLHVRDIPSAAASGAGVVIELQFD